MNENTPTTRMQTIITTTRDDVRPSDHITWEQTEVRYGLTLTTRREGIAHHRDSSGDWVTAEGGWLTSGEGEGVTLTIHRAIQELPTKDGTVIVPADGHEYITATFAGVTYRAREAILLGENQWHAAWRSDTSVMVYLSPERIDLDTWKKGTR